MVKVKKLLVPCGNNNIIYLSFINCNDKLQIANRNCKGRSVFCNC